MAENPVVLNDYRLREDFFFDTPEFQILLRIIKEGKSAQRSFIRHPVENAWYHVLSLDLPAEMSLQELGSRSDFETVPPQQGQLKN